MDQINLLRRFPFLLPRNKSYTSYGGFIYKNGEKFTIVLDVPNYPRLHNISVCIFNQSSKLDVNNDEFDYSTNLYEFMLEFEKKLTSVVNTNTDESISINLEFIKDCENLILEEDVKLHVNTEISEITITKNNHYFKIERKEKVFVVKQHSLPEIVKNEFCKEFKPNTSLHALNEVFKHNLQLLERFYMDLEEIDLVCCVLDPLKPSTKDVHRQISLGSSISMLVELSPWSYGKIPKITFIGPSELTDNFTKCVARNLQHWNEDINLFRNLLTLLDLMYFPSKKDANNPIDSDMALTTDGECCICFSRINNSKLASIVCENNNCNQYFHADCLYDWLRPIANHQTTTDFIQGICPNCERMISCPLCES